MHQGMRGVTTHASADRGGRSALIRMYLIDRSFHVGMKTTEQQACLNATIPFIFYGFGRRVRNVTEFENLKVSGETHPMRVCPQAGELVIEEVEEQQSCCHCDRLCGNCVCEEWNFLYMSHDWCSYCNPPRRLQCSKCTRELCICPHSSRHHICTYVCPYHEDYCPYCSQFGFSCVCSPDENDENDQIIPHAVSLSQGETPGEIMSAVRTFATVQELDGSDELISVLEGLCILMYQAIRSDSALDLVVALLAYMKANFSQSICKVVCSGFEMCATDESIVPHAWSAADIKQRWTLLKTNTIFTKIAYLISAVLSLSVCKVNGVEWKVDNFKIFSLPCVEEQLSAASIIDALVDVFEWTSTVGYKILETGNYDCLFYSDNRLQDFDNDYLFCLTKSDAILNGNTDMLGEFELKVDKCIETAAYLRKSKANASLNIWLTERLGNLMSYKERIISKRRNTAIRFRPLGLGLTGPSGVGKSTLAKIVMKTTLQAMDFEYDTNRIITKDMFDKYDSTYTSDILGIYLDDLGNGKAQFVVSSPTDIIIKFFNNMAAQAVKAEIQSKGLVYIDFKVGVITSNHPDYSVNLYTEIPEASLSRLIHTRVSVKDKFRKAGSVALNNAHPDLRDAKLTHDIWSLTIEESIVRQLGPGRVGHDFRIKTVNVDGKQIECKNLDLKTYLKCMVVLARDHKASQFDVMARALDYDKEATCRTCCLSADMCDCDVFKSHVSSEIVVPNSSEFFTNMAKDIITSSTKSYLSTIMTPYTSLKWWLGWNPIRQMTTKSISDEMATSMLNSSIPYIVSFTPNFIFQTSFFQWHLKKMENKVVWYDFRHWWRFVKYGGLASMCYSLHKDRLDWFALSAGITYVGGLTLYAFKWARFNAYKQELSKRSDVIRKVVIGTKTSTAKNAGAALAAIILGLKGMRMYLNSMVDPNSLVDDSKPGWFGYFTGLGTTVERQGVSNHATTSQLVKKLSKNVVMIEASRDDGSMSRSNAFLPRKGVLWMPKHMFHYGSDMTKPISEHMTLKVMRGKGPGASFEQKITASMCVFTEIDLVVVNISKCPDVSTVTSWLPLTRPSGSSMCKLMVRKPENVVEDSISVEYGDTAHSYLEFYGGEYKTHLAVVGSCMGPLVHDGKKPVIMGFHIGGSQSGKGVMQTVTMNQHLRWLEQLEAIPGNFVGAEASEIPDTIMGKKVTNGPIHPHAEASRLPDSAGVLPIAATPLRAKQKSTVVKSCISDHVADVFEVESKWGKPELEPNWKCYNAALEHISNPSDTFFPDDVEKARQDWLKPLLGKVGTIPDIRVLSLQEAIMGIPGERFVDPLNMSTSMCHPVYGKKRGYFTDVCDTKNVLVRRDPDPLILEEMERVLSCYRSGKRANVVWSSNLKDEPTVYTKKSVRVFQGSPIVLTLLMRKYFLKLARFVGMNSLDAECAVGVNAFGPEWESLMQHALKYSEQGSNILGWDYSKYDLRMSSQMTIAAYVSLIDLARAHGYSKEDLHIMKMMVYDIVHPLLDFNGTLIQAFNMNTSGNSLTVFVNSIVGSLYVRLGFYHVFPNDGFRECVAAMTYGDDFIGSVKKGYENFNFLSYQKYLEQYGMKITHPDKKTIGSEFLAKQDADFLKRKSTLIPEIGHEIGALTEDSIFKSLHANLRSVSAHPREVAANVIECAMYEWFAHGREVYEARREKMQEVCRRASLPVPAVDITFDERALLWKEKYE